MQQILGALIIVGVILVFSGRRLLRQRAEKKADVKEITTSTERLKQELKESADTVIERIDIHIKHLENLIGEMEKKDDELKKHMRESDVKIRTLEGLFQRVSSVSIQPQRQTTIAPAPYTVTPAPSYTTAPMPQTQPAYRTDVVPQDAPPAPWAVGIDQRMRQARQPVDIERQDALDFAEVLHDSIRRDEADAARLSAVRAKPAGTPQQESRKPMEAYEEPDESVESEEEEFPATEAEPVPMQRSETADKIRALLMSGESVEDVARETGMGIGAIQLVREMSRRELERN